MKKVSLIVILLAVFVAGYMWWPNLVGPYESFGNDAPQGKLMSVENYITQNISDLSPIKETLGGKFYVTKVDVYEGRGTVFYEDGHSSYLADFSYISDDRTGHTITSFVIRN